MMTNCLIDTSSWIEALRADGDPKVRSRVSALMNEGKACLCDMVLLELWNGARGDLEKKGLKRLEQGLLLLNTDNDVWDMAKELALTCRSKGVTVPTTDLLVFACAARHRVDIEHSDEHFELIRQAIKIDEVSAYT